MCKRKKPARGGHTALEMRATWPCAKSIDERQHGLRDMVPDQNLSFTYEYDFGDGWQNEILVENILAPQPGRYPVCLAGARAYFTEEMGR